ncbi:conserved hypothetical protein [Clostridium botulinum BKT015925]|nr:conserved hypothetical protein [Clostridium botulinum BKT015925]
MEGLLMAKDSQPDNKLARMIKCNFQTPITSEEGKNHNRTLKKHSIKRQGFQSDHIN